MGSWAVASITQSVPVLEGAGVHLRRAIGMSGRNEADPILLLDHFESSNPADYVAGFPWHPHRGIETVTYMLAGEVEHGDSMGNKGVIRSGEVQWMTAGSGIIHQEMPKRFPGNMNGFQLWVNLPRKHKMTDPRYNGITPDEIPLADLGEGAVAKLISGKIGKEKGPVRDLFVGISYFHVMLKPGAEFSTDTGPEKNAFAYVFDGDASVPSGGQLRKHDLALFKSPGQIGKASGRDGIRIVGGKNGAQMLFVSGVPLNEPVAWGGPIVMNTDSELSAAYREISEGTFIRKGRERAASPLR